MSVASLRPGSFFYHFAVRSKTKPFLPDLSCRDEQDRRGSEQLCEFRGRHLITFFLTILEN